ncbi:MAG TPA: hypothetical protein VFZ65_20435 [Planctomycetota bacterium]|nr:hypothetical protein [Planctomycetota bacterium]
MRTDLWISTLSLVLAGGLAAQAPERPKAEPAIDAAWTKALAKAKVHNQRVLALLVDDDADLAASLKKDGVLSHPLLYEFETVQWKGKQADALAVQWGFADAVQRKPALAVFDAQGKALAKWLPADFTADGKVLSQPLLDKLTPLFCAPVDAEKKLADGIAEAAKSGRAVFVRFDAPW